MSKIRSTFPLCLICLCLISVANPLTAVADSPNVFRQYERARVLYDAGEYAEALKAISAVVQRDPRHEFRVFRAHCLYRTDDQFAALKILEEILASEKLNDRQEKNYVRILLKLRSTAGRGTIRVVLVDKNRRQVPHPDTVRLTVDGEERLERVVSVVPGSHRLQLKTPMGLRKKNVFVPMGKEVLWRVSAPAGIVVLPPSHSGDLYVDGTYQKPTRPNLWWVNPGTRIIELRKDGARVLLQTIVIAESERVELQGFTPPGGTAAKGPTIRRIAAWSLLGTGSLVTLSGVVFHILAAREFSGVPTGAAGEGISRTSQRDAFARYGGGQSHLSKARYLYVGGGLALVSGIVWLLIDPPPKDASVPPRSR